MHEEIVIAGFGGQGVMFAGQLLAYGALREGRYLAWVPSYGPEMRGGTAHATVIISDEEIGSLVVAHPTIAIVLNLPSLERFAPAIRSGGLILVNSSLISEHSESQGASTLPQLEQRGKDLNVVMVPASEIALNLGNERLANVVMVGALLTMRRVISVDSAIAALPKLLPEKRRRLLDINETALRKGMEFGPGGSANE